MPKVYFSIEDKQITDIQRYVIGTRKQKHITQEQMARAIGKSRVTYTDREKDMSSMRLGDFLITLHELGLDLKIYEKETECIG